MAEHDSDFILRVHKGWITPILFCVGGAGASPSHYKVDYQATPDATPDRHWGREGAREAGRETPLSAPPYNIVRGTGIA